MNRIVKIILAALTVAGLYACMQEVMLKNIRLSAEEMVLTEGEDSLLVVTFDPEEAVVPVSWSSNDESVVTVDASGKVTAVSGGRAFVLAKAAGITKGCAVTIKSDVKNVTLADEKIFLTLEGESSSKILEYTTDPAQLFESYLLWESDNTEVAVVSNGNVVAKGLGKANIKVWSEDNPEISDICEVEVGVYAGKVSVAPSEITVYEGDVVQLSGTVTPDDATYKDITWSSSDESIVVIDSVTGQATAVSKGEAMITAEVYGGAKGTCSVKVLAHATGIEIVDKQDKYEIYPLETIQLVAKVYPEDAGDCTVLWNSNNTDVADVDDHGFVTAKAVGTARITAVSRDGGFTDYIDVTVLKGTEPVASVAFDQPLYKVLKDKSITIIPVVLPLDADDKSLIWTSSDETIATVTSDGLVTGKAIGNVTLTIVSISNPELSATCQVRVYEMDINESIEDMEYGEEFNGWEE